MCLPNFVIFVCNNGKNDFFAVSTFIVHFKDVLQGYTNCQLTNNRLN